jgi:hypothetical protein
VPFTGAEGLAAEFNALHYSAQAKLLARLIHMETVYVRAAFDEDPSDGAALYRSSEFVHRLSGIIMVIIDDHEALDVPLLIGLIIHGLEPRGRRCLDQLCEWVSQEATEK